jgi:hypothetical protein
MAVVLFTGQSKRRHWTLQLCVLLLPFRGCLAAAARADVAADELLAFAAD